MEPSRALFPNPDSYFSAPQPPSQRQLASTTQHITAHHSTSQHIIAQIPNGGFGRDKRRAGTCSLPQGEGFLGPRCHAVLRHHCSHWGRQGWVGSSRSMDGPGHGPSCPGVEVEEGCRRYLSDLLASLQQHVPVRAGFHDTLTWSCSPMQTRLALGTGLSALEELFQRRGTNGGWDGILWDTPAQPGPAGGA